MKIKRKSKKIKGENKKKVERENGCKKVDYIVMKNERKLEKYIEKEVQESRETKFKVKVK